MAQKSYSIMLERWVFKKDHRRIVPTFDRSAEMGGEKEKCAAFLKLPLFLFVFQYLHSDQV